MDSDYLFGNRFRRTPAPTGLTSNCIRVLVKGDSASRPGAHAQNSPVNRPGASLVQPLACASFAKRAAVHSASRSSSDVPGCTIVPWSSLANVQYSRRWPVAQAIGDKRVGSGRWHDGVREALRDQQRCRDWVIHNILWESAASDALSLRSKAISYQLKRGSRHSRR